MQQIKKILFIALSVFILFTFYLYLNQRTIMYHPDHARPDPATSAVPNPEVVRVKTSDGLALEGWYFPPKTAKKNVLVFAHGNVKDWADRVPKVRHYIDAGYGALMIGYRGYGGNPGSPTEQGLYADARAFTEFLVQEKSVPSGQIVFYGESLGTGIAVQMASEYDFAGVVLEAPYTSTVDVAQRTYFYLPVKYLMHDQYRSLDKVQDVIEPVIIIHGRRDAVIPFSQGQSLFMAFEEMHPEHRHIFVPFDEAGHNNLYDYGAPLHVLEFLRSIEGQMAV